MPGAWPSGLDDEDVEASADKNISPTRLGTNIYNAVSFLRDSSYNLYNKIFHSNQRASTNLTSTPATLVSENDERAWKRPRFAAEEHSNVLPKVESASYPQTISPDSSQFGDPMDIDSPCLEKLDGLDISPPQSPIHSSHSPIAMNTARRATRLFSNGKKPLSKRNKVQTITPPPEDWEEVSTRREESARTTAATYNRVWQPPPPPKYTNIHEFFDHDGEHGLPGLEQLRLTPNESKIYELDSQRQERLRIEKEKAEKERQELLRIAKEKEEKERQERLRKEQEAANKRLGVFGLRKAKAALITPLSDEWDQKAAEAPSNGHISEIKWQGDTHKDSVELTPHDFSRLVPAGAWLNDNAIQAALLHLAIFINNAAGIVPKKSTPKCVAISSLYWSGFQRNKQAFPRGLARTWGMRPDNFLDIDTVLIPVNKHNHWTVLVIRPLRRTIAYLDSYYGSPGPHIRDVRGWLQQFLGPKYVANEWNEELYDIPRQSNGYDCGVFVITNSICLALGIDPYCYDEDDLPLQRRRIAAMLLNGGFTGQFDLSHL
ncbi:cysteine proteinase [Hypoxylon cercidicola]|nr:cysteine proteinase [Hypoxylon cercidicola]